MATLCWPCPGEESWGSRPLCWPCPGEGPGGLSCPMTWLWGCGPSPRAAGVTTRGSDSPGGAQCVLCHPVRTGLPLSAGILSIGLAAAYYSAGKGHLPPHGPLPFRACPSPVPPLHRQPGLEALLRVGLPASGRAEPGGLGGEAGQGGGRREHSRWPALGSPSEGSPSRECLVTSFY